MATAQEIRNLQLHVMKGLDAIGLPRHLGYSLANAIDKYLLLEETKKDVLTDDGYGIVLVNNIVDNNITGSDVTDVTMQMIHMARERSRGSAILSRVFVNPDVYREILEEFGLTQNTVCLVQKVKVLPSQAVPFNCVVGVCSPQHEDVNVKLLVLGGFIEKVSDASK